MKGTIRRRGKRSWEIKYDLPRDHQTGQRRTAYKTVKGLRADAERELRAILSRMDRGVLIEPTKITVGEYLDEWLDKSAPRTVAPVSLQRYHSLSRNQIKPHLGTIPLQRLRPADIDGWLQNLIEAGNLSTRTIRHAHGVLRRALAHATAIEIIERNVASIIKPPTLQKTEMAILTAGEISETLARMKGHSLYPIIALAIGTGARRGEIAALRWVDINLDGAAMRIERSLEQTKGALRVKLPKTAAGRRTVSLPAFAVAALRDHRRQQLELRLQLGLGTLPPDFPVFGNHEGDWPKPYSISDRWRDAVRNRKLPKVTFHGLRHSHASALIAAGLDVVTVSRRLGHASPALTLGTYSHLFKNNDAEAAAAIDAALGGNIE
ncbi:MAG: site-specific integrase [Alphaproteobacteria bacterium]|nr:site-specific integrase [Alphaproteobacteria bacterium]